MQPFSPLFIAAAAFLCAVGMLIWLLTTRTQERRGLLREIRTSSDEHILHCQPRQLLGDPAAFRLSGYTFSGLHWTLRTEGTGARGQGCHVRLRLSFPDLAGDPDVAVLPRDESARGGTSAPALTGMREFPTGLAVFDSKYEVVGVPRQMSVPPVDRALAERFLNWPRDAVSPRTIPAWRDPSGCHLEARLPSMPNLDTIRYFVALGEDFCARLPAPVFSGRTAPTDLVSAK